MPVLPTAGCGLLPSHPSCGGGAQGALGCGRPILCCDSAAPPRAPASGEWVGLFRGGRGHLEVGGVADPGVPRAAAGEGDGVCADVTSTEAAAGGEVAGHRVSLQSLPNKGRGHCTPPPAQVQRGYVWRRRQRLWSECSE